MFHGLRFQDFEALSQDPGQVWPFCDGLLLRTVKLPTRLPRIQVQSSPLVSTYSANKFPYLVLVFVHYWSVTSQSLSEVDHHQIIDLLSTRIKGLLTWFVPFLPVNAAWSMIVGYILLRCQGHPLLFACFHRDHQFHSRIRPHLFS